MGLRFILGRAGTGKTWLCLEEIVGALAREGDPTPLLFLVPEQATFQVERALAARRELAGFSRLHVVSFRRLAFRVLGQVGGASLRPVGPAGKLMLLRAVLEELDGELRLLRAPAGPPSPGLLRELQRFATELARYRVTPAMLREAAASIPGGPAAPGPLSRKWQELARVVEAYRARLCGRFVDPDDYLDLLARQLAHAPLARGARVWVDGFASFTAQELAVLGALLQVAREVSLTLCLDPERLPDPGRGPSPGELFRPTVKTYQEVSGLARQQGIPLLPPVCLRPATPPRFHGPALAALEKGFAAQGLSPAPPPRVSPLGAPTGLRLVRASSREAEIRWVAREILRLCREEGYRFRDLGVVTRRLTPYQEAIRAVFSAYGIPFFLDLKRSLDHHPAVELVRSACEVLARGWPLPAVIGYLKTDLAPVTRGDADRLENRALARGVEGRETWLARSDPWRAAGESDAEAARRLAALEPLARLEDDLRALAAARGQTEEACRALVRFLDELHVPEKLDSWAQEAAGAGRLEEAQEHRQVWEALVDLLEQQVEVLGDQPFALADFLQVLAAGLGTLQVGLIPPSLDQVLVGAVDRSRQPELRGVFLVGLVDGEFPALPGEDTLLTQRERELLAKAGCRLGETSEERYLHEPYLAYVALTRASHRLYLSYPAVDEGRPLAPSPVIHRLREWFPQLPEDEAATCGAGEIASAADLVDVVVQRARGAGPAGPSTGEPDWRALAAFVAASRGDPSLGALEHRARQAFPALAARACPGRLDSSLLEARLGPAWTLSVSSLQRLAACPFQFFAADLLGLRERRRFVVEPRTVGALLHGALRRLHEHLGEQGATIAHLSAPERAALAAALLQEEVASSPETYEPLQATGRGRYQLSRLRERLATTLWVLAEHARRGSFRPAAAEVSFGRPDAGDTLPGPAISLPGGRTLVLRGRVDRVEVAATADGRRYFRVLDYKSSRRTPSLKEVCHGTELQLGVYCLALAEGGEPLLGPAAPAGMFYVPLAHPVAEGEPGEAGSPEGRLKPLRWAGFALGDPEVLRLMEHEAAGLLVAPRLNKDGSVRRSGSVVPPGGFEALFGYLRRRIAELVAGMTEVTPAPYRDGQEVACRRCSFRVVCGFDPGLPGFHYRRAPPVTWEELVATPDPRVGGSDGRC